MIPTEGESQALYEIPLPPAVVQRPAAGDCGTAQQPSAGETAYQNYLSARESYLGALDAWAVDFRPLRASPKINTLKSSWETWREPLGRCSRRS